MMPTLYPHLTDTEFYLVDTNDFTPEEARVYLAEADRRGMAWNLLDITLSHLTAAVKKQLVSTEVLLEGISERSDLELVVTPIFSEEVQKAVFKEMAKRKFLIRKPFSPSYLTFRDRLG